MSEWIPASQDACFNRPDDENSMRCFDGTDQEFYEWPWNDVGEDETFVRKNGQGRIECGVMDDGLLTWEPEDQETAGIAFKAAYKSYLTSEIARLQAELASLA